MMGEWYYGKEGQQYGPIDEATLRARVTTGEIGRSDLVWTEGMAEWVPLRDLSLPDLGGLPLTEAIADPVSNESDSPYAPPVSNVSPGPVGGMPLIPPTSGLAIASLVCGILSLSLCFCGGIFGIPAAVCGHMAMRETDFQAPQRKSGRGMATAGLIMGYLGIVISGLGLLVGIVG